MRSGVFSDIELAKINLGLNAIKARNALAYKRGKINRPQLRIGIKITEEIRRLIKK